MSIQILQEAIRRKKTPVAVMLGPDVDQISPRILRNFTDMYGESVMAKAEALRYHGCQVLDAVAEKLPAVVLDAAAYLRYGAMGFDVLANLVGAAKARGLYAIVDCRGAMAEPWLAALAQADGVTVLPYIGADACAAGEDKAVFAVVSTVNASAPDMQRLIAGDRQLYVAAAEQMARQGAAVALEGAYALDIRDLRKKLDHTFFLLMDCDDQTVAYAFDDYGHCALATNSALQYAEDVDAALEQAVAEMKRWVTVV